MAVSPRRALVIRTFAQYRPLIESVFTGRTHYTAGDLLPFCRIRLRLGQPFLVAPTVLRLEQAGDSLDARARQVRVVWERSRNLVREDGTGTGPGAQDGQQRQNSAPQAHH